ncbi:hypothetical protein [Halomarina pelagica]|uniref:hypothetical protein n=1 Tax=Halomarina pelagica TaxID=2961599 RepID=UPI0020C37202|nr:hypothetical protein [Halomarina sp. BND7]
MNDYDPGHCNIGRAERWRRYRYAAVGFVGAVAYLVVIVAAGAPNALVLGLFVPLALGLEWLVQARTAFCVRLALAGRYDFTGSGGTRGLVRSPANRRADARGALRVTVFSITAAGVATAACYAAFVLLR